MSIASDKLVKECEEKMLKTIEAVKEKFTAIRAGRANVSMLDGVKVENYGSEVPLNQIGTVSAPEARLLVIDPWDKSLIAKIEKALLAANLGMTPNNDGRVIRLVLPELTADRRKEYVKLAKNEAENGKIALRNIRKDINNHLKKLEKDKENTIVTFNADSYINKSEHIYFVNSMVYFDNATNAIKRIVFNQKPTSKEGISKKKKIPYKTIDNKGSWEISFTPYKGKLLFSSFLLKGSTIFEYEGKKDKANIEQSFLRTGLQEGKHIKKADRINVEEPFFEYVTPHKQGEAKFMLTKEEQEFINQ